MIKCGICSKKFKSSRSIGQHLRQYHKISVIDYYDRYLRNYRRDEGFCFICGKETNFLSLLQKYDNCCSISCGNKAKSIFNKIKYNNKYNINEQPRCKCGNILKFINYNNGYRKYCSVRCQQNSKVVIEKRKQTCLEKYGVEHPCKSKDIQEKLLKTKSKNRLLATKNNKPLFDYYSPKISWVEETRKTKEGYLKVRCKKCNKWFVPKLQLLKLREQALKGNRGFSENNLYCSNECKNSCSIYHKKKYSEGINPNIDRPYHQEWALEVKRIANYECEICGSKELLEAHHIEPVKLRPDLQADIDNGICLCKECHMKYGHKDECSTGNLARMIC